MPPVEIRKLGSLPKASLIDREISPRLSATVVIRVTLPPSLVTWVAIHEAFVLTVFPSKSSFPTDNISTVHGNFAYAQVVR